jgi:hypothetical protein
LVGTLIEVAPRFAAALRFGENWFLDLARSAAPGTNGGINLFQGVRMQKIVTPSVPAPQANSKPASAAALLAGATKKSKATSRLTTPERPVRRRLAAGWS